jgi:hypothetical protein
MDATVIEEDADVVTENEETSEVEEEDNMGEEGEDEVEQLDNMDRCHKCLKPSFLFKKEFYCAKCVRHGMVKAEEEEPVQCRKCRKTSYRSKNKDFCQSECAVETAMETLEEVEEAETTIVPEAAVAAPSIGILGTIFGALVRATTWGVEAPTQDATSET